MDLEDQEEVACVLLEDGEDIEGILVQRVVEDSFVEDIEDVRSVDHPEEDGESKPGVVRLERVARKFEW